MIAQSSLSAPAEETVVTMLAAMPVATPVATLEATLEETLEATLEATLEETPTRARTKTEGKEREMEKPEVGVVALEVASAPKSSHLYHEFLTLFVLGSRQEVF